MKNHIVGICRFSFLGKCDWHETIRNPEDEPGLMERRAELLYSPERLARRFQAFERLCLPSIRAQTDPDFEFWVLTSPEMPQVWQDRLQALCADVPQIRIILSEKRNTKDALSDELRRAARAAGGPVIQFRVDDDDAFSRHHIARIRVHAKRFADVPTFAISFPQGLVFGSYSGEDLTYWRAHQPFLGAGVAVRMHAPHRAIFAFNHFQVNRHFLALTDVKGYGYVQLRWDEGDSVATIVANFPKWFQPLEEQAFRKALADDFPFLEGVDLSFAQRKGAAEGRP